MKWLINKIKNLFNKGGKSSPVVVKPVDPIPEIPTQEEVENFPNGFDLGKWAGIKIDENRKAEVQAVVNFFIGSKTRYVKVENICGVPAPAAFTRSSVKAYKMFEIFIDQPKFLQFPD